MNARRRQLPRCCLRASRDVMKRRGTIKFIAGSAVTTCIHSAGAATGSTPVIGYLGLTSAQADACLLAPFTQGLEVKPASTKAAMSPSNPGLQNATSVDCRQLAAELVQPERRRHPHRRNGLGTRHESGDPRPFPSYSRSAPIP